MERLSRRAWIKMTGAAMALAAGDSALDVRHKTGPVVYTPRQSTALASFDHVIVLMMENRSFDNLLGYLYGSGTVPRDGVFEGLWGKDLSNPIPPHAAQAHRQVVPVHQGIDAEHPKPDPGETYPHVHTQLYGTPLPVAGAQNAAYTPPDPLPSTAPMNGFVADYIQVLQQTMGHAPSYDDYRIIMECFPPQAVPVISTLARQFAVCDHWHAAVPSQTFPNRSFFHAASSSGLVINDPVHRWYAHNTAETLFDRIEALRDRGLSWKVYYHTEELFSYTSLIHHARLKAYRRSHFAGMHRFYHDVRTGNLPSYSFIEPRILFNHNDMHPPVHVPFLTRHSSVLAGERLIHRVYDAIRRSTSRWGSHYQNTLLVITFDEHGGCYDHVAPPTAVPPDPAAPAGQLDFRFDRLGVRVPTVLVSAFIEPGTVVHTPLHHTSLIKTLSEKWGLGALTARDRFANDIREAFNRLTPRPQQAWPETTPRPLHDEQANNLAHPLHSMQHAFLQLVDGVSEKPALHRHEINIVQDAMRFLRRKKAGMDTRS